MVDPVELERAIIENLKTVIDPETGADVVRMQLVRDIQIDENGKVTYIFRPSSPLCPIAVPLALAIIGAINGVQGVSGQSISVVDYVEAELLTEMLKTAFEP